MPCSDVTEILELELNPDNTVASYSLIKLTCGGKIGNQQLLNTWLKSKSAADILQIDYQAFISQLQNHSILNEFLFVKHFMAIKAGIEVLFGTRSGSAKNFCTVNEIRYLPHGNMKLLAEIKINILTEEIEACGNCHSCQGH